MTETTDIAYKPCVNGCVEKGTDQPIIAQHDAELLRKHADFIRDRSEVRAWTRVLSAAIYLYEEADAITEGSK